MFTVSFVALATFALGVIIGSFLNVVILRMNTGRGIKGRSICFSCGKALTLVELIPVLSFIIQGGKCRTCKRRISSQYPLVEIATGLLFAGVGIAASLSALTASQWIIFFLFHSCAFSLLLVIAVYDMRHKIIPDTAVYPFIVLAVFTPLVLLGESHYFSSIWIDHIVAGVALALPFFLIWFFSNGALMGFGDVKLTLGLGLLLGLSYGVAAIMLAFWIGALVGVILLLLRRKTLTIKSEIPFAPFLVLGAVLAFIFHIDLPVLAILFTW